MDVSLVNGNAFRSRLVEGDVVPITPQLGVDVLIVIAQKGTVVGRVDFERLWLAADYDSLSFFVTDGDIDI